MENTFNFKRQLVFGKGWEKVVFKHLRNKDGMLDVKDVSDSEYYQGFGIDGIWLHRETSFSPISYTGFDIKTDLSTHKTWKIFIEASGKEDNPGCLITSGAEYFLYYEPFFWKLYYLNLYPLKRWYNKYGIWKKHIEVKNEGYSTEWILVSLDELRELNLLTEEEDIERMDFSLL